MLSMINSRRRQLKHKLPLSRRRQPVPHHRCKTIPRSDVFALVNNATQLECAASCTKLTCPCFDWSSKVWAKGQCRVVGHGKPFELGSSCTASDCETAYTRVPVAPPSPPPSPALQLPISFELVSQPPEDPAGCRDSTDCELNGVCSTGSCVCDRGWKGAACGQLDIGPRRLAYGNGVTPNTSCWGGGPPVLDPQTGKCKDLDDGALSGRPLSHPWVQCRAQAAEGCLMP